MTNGNGIYLPENYSFVTNGSMKVFPEGTDIYEWLSKKTPRWQRLGGALLAIHLFLKGQRKKDDRECDILLYDLWVAWKDTYCILQNISQRVFRAQFEVLKLHRMVSIAESRYKMI